MIKLQALYDRLQRDAAQALGFDLSLSVSRAPLYEALWKDLLDLIEASMIAPSDGSSNAGIPRHVRIERSRQSYDDLFVGAPCPFAFVTLTMGDEAYCLYTPVELVDLVARFLSFALSSDLRWLRQICLFTYKCKSHEVTEKQRLKAIAGFRSRNTTCQRLSVEFYQSKARNRDDTGQTLRIARLLVGIVTDRCDWREIRPTHGPGAVSDSKRGVQKWVNLDGRTTRLCDKFYPLSEYFTPTPAWFDHQAASFCDPIAELAIVPKDRRGPRVICTQPLSLMWIQQGQRRNLERTIETSSILRVNRELNSPSRSAIQFARQDVNGSLALEASRSREFATIDLADASDLVSWGLVKFLFNKSSRGFLAASRATHVKIDDEVCRLHMFAPMGSAMCFPIETLAFWAIATARSLVGRGVTDNDLRGQASRFLRNNLSEVFVFGDDILVRSESCQDCCYVFTELGFKPNLRKTFYRGFYRESCGVDAFYGNRLDVVRLMNATLTSVSDAYALIDLANRARGMGMLNLSEYIECLVESWLGFGLAVGLVGATWRRGFPNDAQGASLALEWNIRHQRKVRFNSNLQYWEARSIIVSPVREPDPDGGRSRLFRSLTAAVDEHTADWLSPDNLRYYLGWVRAF